MNFDIKPIFPACNDFDDLHDGMDIVIDLGGSMFPAKVIAKPGYDFFEWEGDGGFPEVGGQLCQVCVEKRLGRKLLTNDFSILPEE